jgi:predicted enzyme related to lactoylglutathione lyase
MASTIRPFGMTLQVHVSDIAEGRRFYTTLFGRAPDFEPHEDFLEWRVLPGVELWWQIVGVPQGPRPLATRVRLLVADIGEAVRRAEQTLGVATSAVTTLPGVVRFTDFEDPWGNRLGFYEDIVPSDEQPSPGGSVHDPSQYEVEQTIGP